jgi:hypothetical protein
MHNQVCHQILQDNFVEMLKVIQYSYFHLEKKNVIIYLFLLHREQRKKGIHHKREKKIYVYIII